METKAIAAMYDLVAEEYAAVFCAADVLEDEARYVSYLREIGPPDARLLLDVGCGPALYYPLADAEHLDYVGVDPSSEMLRVGRRLHPEALLLVGDAGHLGLPDAFACVAVAMGSLSHLPPKQFAEAITEVRRVLRARGAVLIGDQLGDGHEHEVPFPLSTGRTINVFARTLGEYEKALAAEGFRVARIEVRQPLKDETPFEKVLLWATMATSAFPDAPSVWT